MRHVHHQHRTGRVGDLPHTTKVDGARIGAIASEEDQRAELERLLLERVVVDEARLAAHAVAVRIEHLRRDVEAVAVCEVAPRVIVQAE